jgi:hypothetical protein
MKDWPQVCVLLWLLVSKGIARLVLAGRGVLRLQNHGFDGASANRTNVVLSRAAITKRSGQRNSVEHVWDVQRGELSGLSGNL